MKFEFTLDQVNLIMASLGKMPYESVFNLVEDIRAQAQPQLPAEAVSAETDAAVSDSPSTAKIRK